jgi:hypothetical protein
MIRPASFGFNEQTAVNNSFQQQLPKLTVTDISVKAREEFDGFVKTLQLNGIDVLVYEDTADPPKPDAVFPNNWITMGKDGQIFLFPLYAPNRRLEKRKDIITSLKRRFVVTKVTDLSGNEQKKHYLEGTGSMIIDPEHKIIYAAISPRTHISLLHSFAEANEYKLITFTAKDSRSKPIYHTNVMLSIGEDFAILCEECIASEKERKSLYESLQSTGHNIIPISLKQVAQFAGNVLQLKNAKGEKLLVMSETARASLNREQIDAIRTFTKILPVSIPTIETIGGGGARCMMAEVFLQSKKQ